MTGTFAQIHHPHGKHGNPSQGSSSVIAAPIPDRDQIRRTLEVFHTHDAIVELRALHKAWKRTDAGYFDGTHRDEFIEEAVRLNAHGAAAVYVLLNPADPQLLARTANRVKEHARDTATDANVTCRRWFLIDVDPQRPKDTSSTDVQLKAAFERARRVCEYLTGLGWPDPVKAESGNGAHLNYRIDLPNNEASRDLLKACLEALAAEFDDEIVKIDRSVFNAGRIVKLYGTVANKGDNLPFAPWRLSKLRYVPDPVQPVSLELLEALAAAKLAPKVAQKPQQQISGAAWGEAEVAAFLTRGGLEASGPDSHGGSLRWKLKQCPFNEGHGPSESAVFLNPDGRLGFKCQHNSCAHLHWTDLRALVDGPKEHRTAAKLTGFVRFDSAQTQPLQRSLPSPLPEVPQFDLGLLPESIRPWVEDHAEALQCPAEYVAVGAVVALAGTIGRQLAICVKQQERWIERAILWGCIVGRPSAGKSPALRPAYGQLTRLESSCWDEYQQQIREFEARELVASAAKQNAQKIARQKLEKGDSAGALAAAEAAVMDDQEPQQARLIVNDGTVEKIGEILNANRRGLVQFRDELSGWLASLDREGREGDRAFWLECWAGTGPYTVDRIGRGTLRVEACAVSILGGTQPGKLAEYVRACCKGGSGDDGLLPRFQLMVYPDSPKEWRYLDRTPNQHAQEQAWQAFQRLNALDVRNAERVDFVDVPFLRFDLDAQALFAEWQTGLMARLRRGNEPPFIESHLAKYPALAGRLALILHLADGGGTRVSAEALAKALDWCEYLEGHARRIYAPVTDNGLTGAHALLSKRDQMTGDFTLRDLGRKGWAGLDRETLTGALEWLEEYGHVEKTVSQTTEAGGRPTAYYRWRSPS